MEIQQISLNLGNELPLRDPSKINATMNFYLKKRKKNDEK